MRGLSTSDHLFLAGVLTQIVERWRKGFNSIYLSTLDLSRLSNFPRGKNLSGYKAMHVTPIV